MNDEHLENMLSSIRKDVNAPRHRTALRSALMKEHARSRRSYFTLQTLTSYITMKTALLPVSAFAVLALVLVGTFGVTQKSVSAQEVAQRAMSAATRLSPEIRAQLETKLKADMMETLKEAYAAPDLRILTAEEYSKEAQFTISTSSEGRGMMQFMHKVDSDIQSADAPKTIAFKATRAMPIEVEHDVVFERKAQGDFVAGTMVGTMHMNPPVKYLRYTAPDGRKVTLGLDETDTPVFLIEELTATDVVKGPDGSINIEGKVLHQVRVHTQNFDGGFGTAGAVRVEAGGQSNY